MFTRDPKRNKNSLISFFLYPAIISARVVRFNTIAGSNPIWRSVLLIGPTSLRGSW